ncbi:cryptochrome/photolyase family protein [Streptomyces sp. NPDC058525]|uniref:cryptochrome/photolyase family protein n=1 Tax=Streptomyces sp. NPDC058525 TaxID=3346538 RepID=UPI003659CD6B
MTVAIVLYTSDLRVHDHPPLRAALSSATEVVPLFVRDSHIEAAGFDAPNRQAFLADCLTDLDAGLRARGGRLILRSGDPVAAVGAVAQESDADEVHMAAGVSAYARAREERLRAALEREGRRLYVHDSVVTAVAPGEVLPAGSDHFAVFTPYFRHWAGLPLRAPAAAPRKVPVPEGLASGPLPARTAVRGVSELLARGGESEGRELLNRWLGSGIRQYADTRDDLAGDVTSRLSPHLHFGTLSAVEVVGRARQRGGLGAAAFVRQICWRDFHHQVLAARPDAAAADYRSRHDHWRTEGDAGEEIQAWRDGRTGYPVIDAAMRQLRAEGWMHNRARLLTASFLSKTLYVDWRIGARHFLDLLVDGDVANNQLNWQWVAGTGSDTRPNRVLNPLIQARRFDPDGAYVHRWVPELAGLPVPYAHQPWKLPSAERAGIDYPEPVVDLTDALGRFREGRGLG